MHKICASQAGVNGGFRPLFVKFVPLGRRFALSFERRGRGRIDRRLALLQPAFPCLEPLRLVLQFTLLLLLGLHLFKQGVFTLLPKLLSLANLLFRFPERSLLFLQFSLELLQCRPLFRNGLDPDRGLRLPGL